MEKSLSDNIQIIVDNMLCSACGGCAGICPVGAITMQENAAGFLYANLDVDKCVSCRKCISICPSNGTRKRTDLVGNTLNGYLGYAIDREVRLHGQSGGIVTALLQWLLETHRVDGIVVTRFNCNQKRAESFLATEVEEVVSAKGSHYTQTSPVEVILKNQDKRLAAVLLGCQTVCLDQISKKYPKIQLPLLTVGLICGGNLSGHVVDDILNQGKINRNEAISSFRFRDKSKGGWPGDIAICSGNRKISIPKEKRMELKPYYQNYRCMLCAEKMNQCCDIVIGDPWGIKISDESDGYSAIIVRTKNGKDILELAERQGCIFLCPEEVTNIIEGQRINNGLAMQLLYADQVLEKYKWKQPYVVELDCTEQQYSDVVDNKLRYLRKLQSSNSKEEALLLVKKRKKENYHPIKEFLYSLKKKVLK